jgi:hypothetical protein
MLLQGRGKLYGQQCCCTACSWFCNWCLTMQLSQYVPHDDEYLMFLSH